MNFLRTELRGIIAVSNNSGENESPWNMPNRSFTSARVSPPAVNLTLQFSVGFELRLNILSYFLYIFRHSIIKYARPYHRTFCCLSIYIYISLLVWVYSRINRLAYRKLFVSLASRCHPFGSFGKRSQYICK